MDPSNIQWQQDQDGSSFCDFRLIRTADGSGFALRDMSGGGSGSTAEFKSEGDLTSFLGKIASHR